MLALLLVLLPASAAPVDVTADGSVGASSTFPGYSAGDSVDGSDQTSWFSDGITGGPDEQFTWTANHTEWITRVQVFNNANNGDGFTGFGFGSVDLIVRDRSGVITFSQPISLPGATDPNIDVNIGAFGETVELHYHNHDDPACGGFSELNVHAERDALLLTPLSPGITGTVNDALVLNGTPGETVFVGFGFAPGNTAVPGCPGLSVPIFAPTIVSTPTAGPDGVALAAGFVPQTASGATVRVAAVDLSTCRASNVVVHNFP